jgi:hypothetical protein
LGRQLMRVCGALLTPVLLGSSAGVARADLVTSHLTDQQMSVIMPESEISFTAEGRIGDRGGAATFELDLGRVTAAPSQSAQYNWQSGASEPFSLSYDAFLNTVTYSLGGATLSYQPDRFFNEVFVRTRATQGGSVAVVQDLVLECAPVGNVSLATGPNAADVLRVSGGDLYDGFSLTGTAVLTWQAPAPTQSQLAFQVKVGAVPVNPIDEITWGRLKSVFR